MRVFQISYRIGPSGPENLVGSMVLGLEYDMLLDVEPSGVMLRRRFLAWVGGASEISTVGIASSAATPWGCVWEAC
jgi:hypothetical protein